MAGAYSYANVLSLRDKRYYKLVKRLHWCHSGFVRTPAHTWIGTIMYKVILNGTVVYTGTYNECVIFCQHIWITEVHIVGAGDFQLEPSG